MNNFICSFSIILLFFKALSIKSSLLFIFITFPKFLIIFSNELLSKSNFIFISLLVNLLILLLISDMYLILFSILIQLEIKNKDLLLSSQSLSIFLLSSKFNLF